MSRGRAIVEASRLTSVPRLLAMLSVLAVFVPSFFMQGVARQLFVPLSLAVAFAMVASYLLSSTLVPVLAAWFMHPQVHTRTTWLDTLKARYHQVLGPLLQRRALLVVAYLLVTGAPGRAAGAAARHRDLSRR